MTLLAVAVGLGLLVGSTTGETGEVGMAVAGYLPEWRYLQWSEAEHQWRSVQFYVRTQQEPISDTQARLFAAWGADVLNGAAACCLPICCGGLCGRMSKMGDHLVKFSAFLHACLDEWMLGWHSASAHFACTQVGADGTFAAMDRFPPAKTMRLARAAAKKHGTKLQICFGGNSRTNGFPTMVSKKGLRSKFIKRLVKLCKKHGLHGVDYNWEYPKDGKEWTGLFKLIVETRAAFKASHDPSMVISMAYYPDKRQEALMAKATPAVDALDYMHMMSYDQHGQHSTWEFGKQAVDQGIEAKLPAAKLTMGLPFYARDVKTGEWTTYEDMVKIHAEGTIAAEIDQLGDRYFNGRDMIRRKTEYAKQAGLGGVMIWEVGQDNFMNDLSALDPGTALLPVITSAIGEAKFPRDKTEL